MRSWNEHAVTEGDKLQKSAALCTLFYGTHPCGLLVKTPPSECAIPGNIARFVCLFTSDVEYFDTSYSNTDANVELGEADEGSARICDDAEDDVGETAALITTAVLTGTIGRVSDSLGSRLEILAETAANTSVPFRTANQDVEVEPI